MNNTANYSPIHQYEIERAEEFARAAIKAGFRAYLAEAGNYGFFTDDEGSRVISFQFNGYFESRVSGNYVTDKPKETGSGWQISADSISVEPEEIKKYFNAYPPRWAVGDAQWRLATLEDHQNRYQWSSKYEEVA